MKTTIQPLQQNAPVQPLKGKAERESAGFAQVLTGVSTQNRTSKSSTGREDHAIEELSQDDAPAISEEDGQGEKKPTKLGLHRLPFISIQQLYKAVSDQEEGGSSSGEVVEKGDMILASDPRIESADEGKPSKPSTGRGNQATEELTQDNTIPISGEDAEGEKKRLNLLSFFPVQQLYAEVSDQEEASASSGEKLAEGKSSSSSEQIKLEGAPLTKKEQTLLLSFLKENGIDLAKSPEKNVQVVIEQTMEDKNVIKSIKVDHQNQPDLVALLNKNGLFPFSGLAKNSNSDSEKMANEAQDDQVNHELTTSGDDAVLGVEKKLAQQPGKADHRAATAVGKNDDLPDLVQGENVEAPTETNSGDEGTPVTRHTSGEVPSQPQNGSTTTPVPVRHFSAELSEMIPERMQLMKNGDESHIRIKLSPENLGQLDIRLTTADGKVTAHIVTATSAAKDMIESQLHQLRHSLVQQGVQLDKVEVIQQPQPASQNSFMQDGRSQQGQQFDQGKQRQRKGEYELEENPHITKEVEEGTSGGINYAV